MPHTHHHVFHFLRNRELNQMYLAIALKAFAISLVGIFIPIYLLQLGYTLPQVLVFFAIFAGAHGVFSIPAAIAGSKVGFKHLIFFSFPLLIIALLLLLTLEQYRWPLWIPALLFGIKNAMFWIGYHTDFSKFSHKKKRGTEVGFSRIVASVFTVAGPLIGGLLLTFTGFTILFGTVTFILIIASIPLLLSKDIHGPANFSTREVFEKRKFTDTLAFIGFGFNHAATLVLWPVFLFFGILTEQYTSLGFVTSLSLLFGLIFTFIVGGISNKKSTLLLRIGSVGHAIVWFLRGFVKTPFHVFAIDSIAGMTNTLVGLPFDVKSYDKANKQRIIPFIAYRETTINLARAVFFIAMIPLTDLATGFVLGGVLGSLLHILF